MVVIGLGVVVYNVVCSVGLVLGGVIVMVFGVNYVFVVNFIFYILLFVVFFFWCCNMVVLCLLSEWIGWVLVLGMCYVKYFVYIIRVLFCVFVVCLCVVFVNVLFLLIVWDILGGEVDMYGLLLGVSGIGVVIVGFMVNVMCMKLLIESVLKLLVLVGVLVLVVVGLSKLLLFICVVLFIVSGVSIFVVFLFNVIV